ncbi:hypothetical protein N9L28_05670 [Luminiphilus sp.]|nr:hypothetical protein [Luminiphilus sp.]
MTAVIRAKTWEQHRDHKITAGYVRLSEENRRLKKEIQILEFDYNSAMERVCDLEDRIENMISLIENKEVRS